MILRFISVVLLQLSFANSTEIGTIQGNTSLPQDGTVHSDMISPFLPALNKIPSEEARESIKEWLTTHILAKKKYVETIDKEGVNKLIRTLGDLPFQDMLSQVLAFLTPQVLKYFEMKYYTCSTVLTERPNFELYEMEIEEINRQSREEYATLWNLRRITGSYDPPPPLPATRFITHVKKIEKTELLIGDGLFDFIKYLTTVPYEVPVIGRPSVITLMPPSVIHNVTEYSDLRSIIKSSYLISGKMMIKLAAWINSTPLRPDLGAFHTVQIFKNFCKLSTDRAHTKVMKYLSPEVFSMCLNENEAIELTKTMGKFHSKKRERVMDWLTQEVLKKLEHRFKAKVLVDAVRKYCTFDMFMEVPKLLTTRILKEFTHDWQVSNFLEALRNLSRQERDKIYPSLYYCDFQKIVTAYDLPRRMEALRALKGPKRPYSTT